MNEPPGQNRRRQQHHAEHLVAQGLPPLYFSPRLFGHLFAMRLDAGFYHGEFFTAGEPLRTRRPRISIGERKRSAFIPV